MPVSIDANGIWVGDGKGGMKLAEPTVTRMEFGVPGVEHIIIEDKNGIVVEEDPATGRPIVHAESITIASEQKPPRNLFQRLFRRKEG